MSNNNVELLVIKAGQRTAQIVFHKKEEVVFKKVDRLGSTGKGFGGFGSIGI